MTLPDTLAQLPDETPCYVEGYGVVELGTIRGANERRKVAEDMEATLTMWARKATANLCRERWGRPGDGPPGGRA